MNDEGDVPAIEMRRAAAAKLRERGGRLYVWADASGMPRAKINPPPQAISYDTTTSPDGWLVHIDSGIVPPPRWVIKWRRLPWPHFVALYNPPEFKWTRPRLGDFFAGIWDGLMNAPWP